jgi:uncharacterized protein (DUF983 family)
MQERTSLQALIQGKCPRCRQGDIFTYPVKRISKFNVMNETCPVCGVRLEPEPGFYQGAMYVSYGFTVALIIGLGFLLYFLGNPSEWTTISIIIGISLLLVPLNYRYSRIIYLYLLGGLGKTE